MNARRSRSWLLALPIVTGFASPALAQFSGPSQTNQPTTVQQVADARLGSYVTLSGRIVAHQGEDYYTFRDATGEMRVEIESEVWRNREVDPDTDVRLSGEVDRNRRGRYLSVDSLEVVD